MYLYHRLNKLILFMCLFELTQEWCSVCPAEVLDGQLVQFACTNVSISQAIISLARHSPVPINIVIADSSEPVITVSLTEVTIGAALKAIISAAPGYVIMETNQTIVVSGVSPKDYSQHPLSQLVDQLDVKYQDLRQDSPSYPAFSCLFSNSLKTMNILLQSFSTKRTPSIRNFPSTRSFHGQNLFDILNQVSKDMNASWCFYQITPQYAKDLNRMYNMYSNPMSGAWRFNEFSPAYCVTWGRKVIHEQEVELKDDVPNTSEHRKLVEEYWIPRGPVLNRAINAELWADVTIEVVTTAKYYKDDPTLLTLRLRNTTKKQITFANPFLNDPQRAFWAITRAVSAPTGNSTYIVMFPKIQTVNEPNEITLGPQKSYELQVNLSGATTLLDRTESSKQVLLDTIGDLGKYLLNITAYIKTADGIGHALRIEISQFDIVKRPNDSYAPESRHLP